MIDLKKIAELDQAATSLGEFVPRLVKALFDGFMREGFSHDDSLALSPGYLSIILGKHK